VPDRPSEESTNDSCFLLPALLLREITCEVYRMPDMFEKLKSLQSILTQTD